MTDHEHRWIDTTTVGDRDETRRCVICDQIERRALGIADEYGELADDLWKIVLVGKAR